MATKILISFYCPDFSSTGIVKTSFDKVYDCRKFSEHCKTITDMIPKWRKELPPTSRFARRLFWVELR